MPGDETEALIRLFEREVPEIAAGVVLIKAGARKPGFRSKLALYSRDPLVDCIGACVGQRGCRIRRIVDQLGGERLDLVRWDESVERLIRNALQPARAEDVILRAAQHRATVVVKEDQRSLAFGRRGENQSLASRLCGWEIEVVTH
jgi:N utilization substance protein A